MARWLGALGFDLYLYAPKQDSHLRRNWAVDWPPEQRAHMAEVSRACAAAGLAMGVGLSPFALYQHYGTDERRALRRRVAQLNALEIPVLALLFDDMPGDCADLAGRQGEIVADVAAWSEARELLVCPTYYSDDPVLDRFFGPRPSRYLADLGAALPPAASLLWTGKDVCSESISFADLPSAGARGGAALSLWDNYPVNDSRLRSPHLYVAPLAHREDALSGELAGHYCNAMNQAALSLPALDGLLTLYGVATSNREAVWREAGLDHELIDACIPLAARAVDALSPGELARLQRCASGSSMAAQELAAFLRGEYRFDPACLND